MKDTLQHIRRLSIACSVAALTACGGGSDNGSDSGGDDDNTPAPAGSWELVWSDEFDGDTIDVTKWDLEENCWGGGNSEQQCYTSREENAFLSEGMLNIVAIREDYTGDNSPEGDSGSQVTLPYTSARLRTKDLAEWTFGRFEMRARLPSGQGTHPAFWMLPTDSSYGTWPAGGEIDIMEAVNLTVDDEATLTGTLHYGQPWPGVHDHSGATFELADGANPADDFHTYALEWEEGEIRWYVDGIHYQTQRSDGWYAQYEAGGELVNATVGAPFDASQEFHLLINFAVGGTWASVVNQLGIDESAFPQTMLVDWVRVYQCDSGNVDGSGCATVDESVQVTEGNTAPSLEGDLTLAQPPLFEIFTDELSADLEEDFYLPSNVDTFVEDEDGRGQIYTVAKVADTGNVHFKFADSVDMSAWDPEGQLEFDVRVNSMSAGVELLVKIASAWPNVSDVSVPVGTLGEWSHFSINIADLVDNRNSLENGIADLTLIDNPFVIEPNGRMNVSFDNIRYVVGDGPAPDADGDGVPDTDDQCPDTPDGAVVDATGCHVAEGTVPEEAAPTPTVAATSVVSIFSDAYNNILGVNYNPDWGQATVVTEESIAGDNTLLFTGLNYQGFGFESNQQNVSGLTHLHLDYWTANSEDFDVFLINPGPVEKAYSVPVEIGRWVSVDIPLSTFAPVDLTNVFQMKYTGTGDIYLDNVYFYNEDGSAPLDSDGDGVLDAVDQCPDTPAGALIDVNGCELAAPTEGAPTPAETAENVISIFSDTFTNIDGVNLNPGWGQATVTSEVDVAGNNTLRMVRFNYQGTDFANTAQDLTSMTTLHVDYWTPDATEFSVFLISPGPLETAYPVTVQNGAWVSLEIPLSTFTDVDLAEVIQLKYVGDGTVYLDNIYFSNN